MAEIPKKYTIDSIVKKLYGKHGKSKQVDDFLTDLFQELYEMKMSHYTHTKDENLPKHRAVLVFINAVKESISNSIRVR